jgi:hypothetical protein
MRDRRFNLRTVMAVIIVWGVLLAWVQAQGSLGYASLMVSHRVEYLVIAWGFCFLAAFAFARKFGPSIRGRAGRITVLGLLAMVLGAMVYLAWAYCRAKFLFVSDLDRGAPYPDPWINALERWFDARHPARPGTFKLHREYYIVAWALAMLILIFAAMAGLLSGLLREDRPGAAEESRRGRSDREAT